MKATAEEPEPMSGQDVFGEWSRFMICKNCGANVKNGLNYCNKCGADVLTGIVPTAYPIELALRKQKRDRNIKIAVPVVIAILIVVVIVLFIWSNTTVSVTPLGD
jgi:uncharacterized membrane protein YvbJ